MAELSIRTSDEIFNYIREVALEIFPDDAWNGIQEGGFEWLLAKIVSEVSALNGLYADQRANQAYIPTATIRKDIRDICKNLGLVPTERTGATVTLTIVASDEVTIPVGTRFSSSNGLIFSSLQELQLVLPNLEGQIDVINGQLNVVTYNARGDAGEIIRLGLDNVLVSHLGVEVNGVAYTQVDSWANTDSNSLVYVISFDETNKVSLIFGNGTYGKRLGADAEVVIQVFYGGGVSGNSVSAGTITAMIDTFNNSSNVTSITNESSATGGRGEQSLTSIRNSIPSQLRSIAGINNTEDGANVIKTNLDFVADAVLISGYTSVGTSYIPTIQVIAYPFAQEIEDLSLSQKATITSFLQSNGQLGISWSVDDAYAAPLELELEVSLNNKNLALQKATEIKASLNAVEDAPFEFANIGFNKVYTTSSILNALETVNGINSVKINKFNKIPQTLVRVGDLASDTYIADLSLGNTAEDGYFSFKVASTTTAAVTFQRPVYISVVGTDFAFSSDVNWLADEFNFADGTLLNDVDGPYVKLNGGKLEFKQLEKVWVNDEFNGSNYINKHLLRITWVDNTNTPQIAYYHVADTTAPGTIITLEDATAPIEGTAISGSMASSNFTRIKVQIVKDQSASNTFTTPAGFQLVVSHNDATNLYFTGNTFGKIPIGLNYLQFDELDLSTASDNWVANSGALKLRLQITNSLDIGDIVEVYTSALNSNKLYFKSNREVMTLQDENIIIKFV